MKTKFKWSLILLAGVLSGIFIWRFDFRYFKQDPAYGTIHLIQAMTTKRSAHTATVLQDGRVLICGGIFEARGEEINNSSVEIFDPNNKSFVLTVNMTTKRAGHTATLLPNGNVLIAGGFNENGFLASAELYHPSAGKFESLKSEMSEKRAGHIATPLSDGRILISGGVNGSSQSNSKADIYDVSLNQFVTAIFMISPRTAHTGTLLPDGKVLLAGGSRNWRSGVLRECELFDPTTNKFRAAGNLNIPRNKHVAVLLDNGKVLVAGGSKYADEMGCRYSSAEIYDPATNKFTMTTKSMFGRRFKITNAADILQNGNVIIAGDGRYVEVYDVSKEIFVVVKGNMGNALMYPTVTSLPGNRALVTGGYDENMLSSSGAWLYEAREGL